MASRIIHLAITDLLLRQYRCKDPNRLKLGSVLPDAAAGGNSHLKINICGGEKKTYDLTGFRAAYLPNILEDDLYLGYYLHLVQDLYFRDFVYNRYHWDPLPPGNVERLHRDYALINSYVIRKYALSDTVTVPKAFDAEPLNRLGPFAICEFLAGMEADFQSSLTGAAFFFTGEMADEFIAYAREKCLREIDALSHGLTGTDERALAWRRR